MTSWKEDWARMGVGRKTGFILMLPVLYAAYIVSYVWAWLSGRM